MAGYPGYYLDDVRIEGVLDVIMTPDEASGSNFPGEDVTLNFNILNGTGMSDTFNLVLSGITWPATYPASVALDHGDDTNVSVVVTIPAAANHRDIQTGMLTVTGVGSGDDDTADITVVCGASTWEIKTAMPGGGRGWTDFAFFNDYIYSPCGDDGTLGVTRAYDVTDDTWIETTSPTVEVSNFRCDVIGTNLYMPCGLDFNAGLNYTDVQVYDLLTDTWSVAGHTFTGAGPAGQAVVAYNGKLYVFGGGDFEQATPVVTSEVWEYDPAVGWAALSPMSEAKAWARCASDGAGTIYVSGGYDFGTSTTLNSIEAYDVAGDSWTTLTDTLPVAMFAHSMEYYNDYLYIIGGSNGPDASAYAYGPLSGTPAWQELPDMNDARYQHGTSLWNDGTRVWLYAGGGYDYGFSSLIDSMERYQIDGPMPEPPAVPAAGPIGLGILLAVFGSLMVLKRRK